MRGLETPLFKNTKPNAIVPVVTTAESDDEVRWSLTICTDSLSPWLQHNTLITELCRPLVPPTHQVTCYRYLLTLPTTVTDSRQEKIAKEVRTTWIKDTLSPLT